MHSLTNRQPHTPLSFSVRLVGLLLTVGLFGCGCLFPSTPNNTPNPYPDLSKAQLLRYAGEYRQALVKYEQAAKKIPQFPTETRVIHVEFQTLLNYGIAFCYAKLAEAEGDVSLYSKAEAAAKASYETARLDSDQADALYLWGYLLFKQARYEEAAAKFEALLERLRQDAFNESFTADALFGLGKSRLHLGDNAAAQRIFAQLLEHIEADRDRSDFYATEVLFGLGKVFIELGDEPTARRIFARLLEHHPDSLHKAEVERLLD